MSGKIFPFLFEAKNPIIKLNWENSEFKWINVEELKNYETVPSLQKVLFNLVVNFYFLFHIFFVVVTSCRHKHRHT